jgi:hypothetical protein
MAPTATPKTNFIAPIPPAKLTHAARSGSPVGNNARRVPAAASAGEPLNWLDIHARVD